MMGSMDGEEMVSATRLGDVESIFLEDLADDYDGVWRLARMVRDALRTDDPRLVREGTLKLAEDWLISGLVRVGTPHGYDSGFDAWPEEGEAAAARMAAEWSDATRLPTLGEVGWFALTPEGRARKRRFGREGK